MEQFADPSWPGEGAGGAEGLLTLPSPSLLVWQDPGRVIRNLRALKSCLGLGFFLGFTGCDGVELWS